MNIPINIFGKITNIRKPLKVIACILIALLLFRGAFSNGIEPYYYSKDFAYQNNLEEVSICNRGTEIRQYFVVEGNILTNLRIFLGEYTGTNFLIEVLNSNNKVIFGKELDSKSFSPNSWYTIPFEGLELERGTTCCLRIIGENLSSIILNIAPTGTEIINSCFIDGSPVNASVVMALQNTYRYISFGALIELIIKCLTITIITCLISYAIFKIENIIGVFRNNKRKQGILYALYFSVYTTLLIDPLDAVRTKVTEFERVIGEGILEGIDVTKRIGNYNKWMMLFSCLFILFFLLFNFLKSKHASNENKKVEKLLDQLIIIANVLLGLRCITYFYNKALDYRLFYYSDQMIFLIIILAFAYIIFKFERKIEFETYMKLSVNGWIISYPLTIIISPEWDMGRILIGVQFCLSLMLTAFVAYFGNRWRGMEERKVTIFTLFSSFIPLITSVFIEAITILNQHKIFLSLIRETYIVIMLMYLFCAAVISSVFYKENSFVRNWKGFTYPSLIFGVSCLWCQIPIFGIYNADIFESANASILISDFLNYGSIPLVEHYGGHMMSGVWEGIIYGILNNDYQGAIFSPYSGYIATILAVLFFYFVKNIWDEDSAILVTLFLPFYNVWNYWGLGILVAFGAMAYVKKNTYKRAILFWFTFIWCAIYRLDLGFAFGIAGIVGLLIYIIFEKNLKALVQLVRTFIGWGVIGSILWFSLCLYNNINPIDRLVEFLSISLSNQNWAYSHIGNPGFTVFSWSYVFIPLAVVMGLIIIIFSKQIKEELGQPMWVMIMIIGFSYVFNFSRGLVRHSLVEGALPVVTWSAYVFLAVFVASIKCNRKLFIPIFMLFSLCNTLLLTGNNFADISIADATVGRIGTFTDTWSLTQSEKDETRVEKTYWQDIAEKQQVIQRVIWDDSLSKTVDEFQYIIDILLDEDETFIDFMNRTFLYSAMERKNPAYASQTPLQLSGEFTQEQFLKEVESIPIVLMPFDNSNYYLSELLDGVPNSYRYYKVAEYINQKYVPLCAYEDKYSIWCLEERYDEMLRKVEALLLSSIEISGGLLEKNGIITRSAEIINNADGTININSVGTDPMICEIQNIFDVTPYIGKYLGLSIEYETNVDSTLQLFYTTELAEEYSGNKVVTVMTANKGTAYFTIPITKYSRIRLDTPEGSNLKVLSFKINDRKCLPITYGYDGPYVTDKQGEYSFLPGIHNYNVKKLPIIWAEKDNKKSIQNRVLFNLISEDNVYRYNPTEINLNESGNYLKVQLEYNGNDLHGKYKNDDESTAAILKMGVYQDGTFETKYLYEFVVAEGQQDYLFRISNDYYWYLNQINAVVLESATELRCVEMQILEGD